MHYSFEVPENLWWDDLNTGETLTRYESVFEAGHQYELGLWLYAQEGYAFPEDVTATINGKTAACSVSDSGAVLLEYTFPKLSEAAKPSITTQPKSKTVAVGKTASFKVAVSRTGLSYQWQYKKPDGSWTNVSGASGKTATYSLKTETRHNGYQYCCKVTNISGSVYSNTVKLTVK